MQNITNPVKAIKAKCIDCCCGNESEVRVCPCEDCPLHPYKIEKNPYRAKHEYTEEERKRMAERFARSLANASKTGRKKDA